MWCWALFVLGQFMVEQVCGHVCHSKPLPTHTVSTTTCVVDIHKKCQSEICCAGEDCKNKTCGHERRHEKLMSDQALYGDLSHYYDLLCADIDYAGQSHAAARLQQCFGNQGRRHLDLACGTGPHIRHLLDLGYISQGIDLNAPMLAQAQQRCPEAVFSQQNMCDFSLSEPVDFITCFLYSLHYCATIDNLRACLARVYEALTPGGVFCFNSVDKTKIDHRLVASHQLQHDGFTFQFASRWHYRGTGEQQSLQLTIDRLAGLPSSSPRDAQSHSYNAATNAADNAAHNSALNSALNEALNDAHSETHNTERHTAPAQHWQDEHTMVAVSFPELIALLEPWFEVYAMAHDYHIMAPLPANDGNAIFVCVKREQAL